MGGEAHTVTAKLEADLGRRLTSSTLVHVGGRPFRDSLDLWKQAHPGVVPASDGFFGLQQGLTYAVARNAVLGAGASWEHHNAVGNMPGASGNGFRWYADLSFRWPASPCARP